MQTTHTTALTRISAVALLGAGAVFGTACRAETPVAAAPQAQIAAAPPTQFPASPAAWPGTGTGLAPTTGGAPVAVNCGPGQQALIRPSVVGGQAVSQVDCVPLAGAGVSPAAWQPVSAAAVPAAYYTEPRTVEAPVVYRPARQVVYRDAPAPRAVRRTGRSWQKSAVIIGSSAGVGAAVGGAIDGKKGALIGAALAGGGATIWDQATRRK